MSQLYLHSPATKSCVSSPLDVQSHLRSLRARSQESFPLSEAIKSPPSKLPAYEAGERKKIIKDKTRNTRDRANENDLQKQTLQSNKQGQNNIQHQLKEVQENIQQKEGTQHTTAKRQTTTSTRTKQDTKTKMTTTRQHQQLEVQDNQQQQTELNIIYNSINKQKYNQTKITNKINKHNIHKEREVKDNK